ncbi:MAG: hypothetical protein DLM50_02670 [Candidatus Meridianibacter frigidus]|nr:MAG: hypothetical protein DLM50_02670 [Candidatus Eremiobacteraeota bacterium]
MVQLLASFIGTSNEYALARLELSFRHERMGAAPVIEHLSDASEQTLRAQWGRVEGQLEAAYHFVKHFEMQDSSSIRLDPAFGWLRRSIRELDQYARAVRWVLTVTEREDYSGGRHE